MFLEEKQTEDGMDLIEVLIAIVIIIAAIISVTALLIRSQVTQSYNENQDRATLIMQDYMEKSRNIAYQDLGNSKAGTCSSTVTKDIVCNGEAKIVVNGGPIKDEVTTQANGTTFTVRTFVTKVNSAGTSTGWKDVAAGQNPSTKCLTSPSGTAVMTKQNGDGGAHLCTIKRVTVEVEWNKDDPEMTAPKKSSISASWVRSPQPSEELPASIDSSN